MVNRYVHDDDDEEKSSTVEGELRESGKKIVNLVFQKYCKNLF